MGEKSGRQICRGRNSGRFFRFLFSNGMWICVLPGMGSGRIVVHSEQHTLQHTPYSTIEHAATILRMALTPAELCSQGAVSLFGSDGSFEGQFFLTIRK